MSEALLLPLVAAVLLVCDRLLHFDGGRSDGGRSDVVLLGLLVALGALTRGEALVTLAAPVVAAAWVARRRAEAPHRTRPWLVALAIGVTAVVAWSAVVSFRAERPLLVSTNSGSLLLGANCARAHTSEFLGYWSGPCPGVELGLAPETADALAARVAASEADPFRIAPGVGLEREAEIGARQTRAALDEITGDPLAFAGAVPVRLARGLGVYWTDAQTFQEGLEGRDTDWEQRGRWFHLVLVLPATLLALVALAWRRSGPGAALRSVTDVGRIAPMLALVGTWAVIVMATYGSARLRTTIEPALAVLAGLGVVTAIRWWSARRAQPGRSSLAS